MKNSVIRKILAFILIEVLLLGFMLPSASAVTLPLTFTANGKNTSRAADTIIIFTQDGTTGTNIWGYEVTVDKTGEIVSVGGNNSAVPEDGFVLSGHGTGARFLKENAHVGIYASFCPLTLEVTFDNRVHLPFGSKTMELSAINSYRSSNYLVVYTPSFPYATTNTNRWGNEATVENGIITSIGGNNSKIPENGFVISAVENALGWFYDALSVGLSASFSENDKTLTVSCDMNSTVYADRNKLQKLYEKLGDAEDSEAAYTAYSAAESQLDAAISRYEADGDAFAYLSFSREFSHTVDKAAALCYSTCDKEIRGVWTSIGESSREQVENIVEQMYSLGLNSISLCGTSEGVFMTSLPADSPFTSALSLGKEDIVAYYIDACHKRNMKFSLWMPVFFVGYTSSKYVVTKKLPGLQVLSQNNKPETLNGFVFLDPSNPEATSLLLSTYEHILKNYDIDTFELDYIRYAGTGNGLDFGYHTTAQSEFIEQYGETPVYDRSWHLWREWCLFRASYITDFVGDMHELIKRVKPDTLLSADVFGSNDSKYSIYQDWETWTDNGYLDILIPMLYGANFFKDSIGLFSEAVKDSNYILVPGLSVSGDDVPPEVLAEQIKTAREKGASGVNLFCLPSSFKCGNPRIRDGLFRTRAEYPLSFYTVTFTSSDSVILSTQTVKSGTAAASPEIPEAANPHAVFERWSVDFTCVNENMTVSPVYSYTQCVDNDNDTLCDICGKSLGQPGETDEPAGSCSCICHKTGFSSLIYKIFRIFWKMFGIKKTCNCGATHY